jgi:hypothetical protein
MASSKPSVSQQTSTDADWKFFELRYRNLQSISKAQRVHLTTLLIQIALFWIWYVSGSKDVTAQGVAITAKGVWVATPALLTFFCLAFVGSVNAALPAKKRLEDAVGALSIHPDVSCGFAFYDLDTDKNVLDYMTFLKFSPTNNIFKQTARFNVRHFLYPAVMAISIATTFFAWKGVAGYRLHIYVLGCAILQLAFFIRPFYRACRRFTGHDVDN